MPKEMGPRERALREMREARFAARQAPADSRKAKADARREALQDRIKATAERMAKKPAKGKRKKK